MTKKEFLQSVTAVSEDSAKVEKIEKIYGAVTSELVRKIISYVNKTVFLDEDDWRVLSYSEIENAASDLNVDFTGKKLLPLFDCCENDFVVYCLAEDGWAKFNIVDESLFQISSKLEALF